jgi:alpha-tubulin suppressor-like RCC1 family protein
MNQLACTVTLVCLLGAADAKAAPTTVIGRGDNSHSQLIPPPGLTNAVSVAAGSWHSLALKADGTVVAWGGRDRWSQGGWRASRNGTEVPQGLSNVVAIAAGEDYSLALKADGTVIAWGTHFYGQTNPPPGLTNIAAIAAGTWHCMALRANGTVVEWGYNLSDSRAAVPKGITHVVAIASGASHNLILKADGTLVGWGQAEWQAGAVPEGLRDLRAISAGYNLSLALKRDGTVVGWGFNLSGAATANPTTNQHPWTASGPVRIGGTILTDVTAVSAGKEYSLALKRDGTVVGWGKPPPLAGVTNVLAIAAGENHSLFLVRGTSR